METTLQKVARFAFAALCLVALALGVVSFLLPILGKEGYIWTVFKWIVETFKNASSSSSSSAAYYAIALVEYTAIATVYVVYAIIILIAGIRLIISSFAHLKEGEHDKKPFLKFFGAVGSYALLEFALTMNNPGIGLYLVFASVLVCLVAMIGLYVVNAMADGNLMGGGVAALAAILLCVGGCMFMFKPLGEKGSADSFGLLVPFISYFALAIQSSSGSGSMPMDRIVAMIVFFFAGILVLVGASMAINKSRSLFPVKEGGNPVKSMMVGAIVSIALMVIGLLLFAVGDKNAGIQPGATFIVGLVLVGLGLCASIAGLVLGKKE